MQLEVELTALRIEQQFQPCRGRVLVAVEGRQDSLLPGDLIEIYGKIRGFSGPTNPGQRDLRTVYRRRNLHARVDVTHPEQILVLSSSHSWTKSILRMIARTATMGRELLLEHTSKETGSLAVALVLGQRDYVGPKTRDELLVTGTAHLLSVSGLHLAIIVVLASRLATLLKFPLAIRVLWIITICVFYTTLTGGRPPVMRASILVGTLLFATWMKRTSQPVNTLSLAALILMLINPEYVFSVGVQLSFLAVATLVLCGSQLKSSEVVASSMHPSHEQEIRLQELVESSRPWFMTYPRKSLRVIRQMIWFSSCIFFLSLPLVWYQFHVVAPISILVNVLLGPSLFIALAAGVVTIVSGWLSPSLASLPGIICDWMLRWMQWIIGIAAEIPWGHFWLPAPPAWWIVTFYTVIAATFFLLPPGRLASWMRYLWIAGWILVAWPLATCKPLLSDATCEATFLDVGHGTSVVLRLPSDQVWLYDCGHLGNDSNRSRKIEQALWSLGVTHLDGIILSHADADHFNSLPGLLPRFSVDTIITPPGMLMEAEPALDPIRRVIAEFEIPIQEMARFSGIIAGNHCLRVLHPPSRRLAASDNANSLVLRIDHGGTCLILPGDLESPGTETLINTVRPPPGGVLMAPHHGSLRMNAGAVLHWARPRETVVSGGQRARNPEVRQMLAGHGSAVHITARVGAIRVSIDDKGTVDVRDWKTSPW